MPIARHPLRTLLWAACLPALLQGGCGGPGTGSSNGPGPGVDAPPTGVIVAPLHGALALQGDVVPITVVTDDDGNALVRMYASVDASFATDGDQTLVFGPGPDGNGVQGVLGANTAGLVGAYTLFLVVDDGVNPPSVTAMAGPLVTTPAGLAVPAPPRSAAYGVMGTRVTLTVGEAEFNNADLNGDGDMGDGVLAVVNAATGGVAVLGTSTDATGVDGVGTARLLIQGAGRAFAATREQDEGQINADGDAVDVMTSHVDPTVPNVTTNALGGLVPLGPVSGTRCLVSLTEAQEGGAGTDRNNDLDALDTVMALLEGPTDTVIVFPLACAAQPFPRTAGTRAAYVVTEAANGLDLNGSGVINNTLIALANLASPGNPGNIINLVGAVPPATPARDVLPLAAFDVSLDGRVGYYMNEAAAGVPLNGDGDVADQVPAIWDASIPMPVQALPGATQGFALNAGNNPPHALYLGTKFFYTAVEDVLYSPPMAGDNGDGELLDLQILRWTDHAVDPGTTNVLVPAIPGFPTLTGLALDGGFMARLSPGWLAVVVQEAANGMLDLTGDGIIGPALLLVDASVTPPLVWNTGLTPMALGSTPITGVADAGGVVIAANEAQNGDLNADADAIDTLLFYVSFAAPTVPVNLANTAGPHVHVVGTRVGITANEALTQGDFNGDFDSLDFAFRVVSTAGTVLCPGILSVTTSRPTADDGTLWAFLRSEVAEQADLDADGDQLDLVMGFWRP